MKRKGMDEEFRGLNADFTIQNLDEQGPNQQNMLKTGMPAYIYHRTGVISNYYSLLIYNHIWESGSSHWVPTALQETRPSIIGGQDSVWRCVSMGFLSVGKKPNDGWFRQSKTS